MYRLGAVRRRWLCDRRRGGKYGREGREHGSDHFPAPYFFR